MAEQSALLRLSIHVNNWDAYLDKSYVACAVWATRGACAECWIGRQEWKDESRGWCETMRKASLATMSPIQKMKVLVDHYSTFKGRMNIILTCRLEGVGSKRVSCFRLCLRSRTGNLIINYVYNWTSLILSPLGHKILVVIMTWSH